MKVQEPKMQTTVITKILLLSLGLLVTGSAWAEWVKVSKGDMATYIDQDTIRQDGNLRKVWELRDFKQRDKDGSMSVRTRSEYDCKGERYRFLSASEHSEPMAGGVTLRRSQYNDDEWQHVPPGSVGDIVMKIVCAK